MKKMRYLSVLFFISMFIKANSMEESSSRTINKKRKAEDVLLNDLNKVPEISWLSAIPAEVNLMIFQSAIKNIIKDNANNAINAFNAAWQFVKNIILVDQNFRNFKNDLIKFVDRELKEHFGRKYIDITPEERNSLLDKLLKKRYSKKNECEAAQLIIAGAGLHAKTTYKRNSMSLLKMILKLDKFKQLYPLLIKYNPDINRINCFSCESILLTSIKLRRAEFVEMLLKHKLIDINALYSFSSNIGWCALSTAIEATDLKIVKMLLACKDLNINQSGRILSSAIDSRNLEIIKIILDRKDLDVNVKDNIYGETALMSLINSRDFNLNIIKMLLGRPDLDINVKNKRNDNALTLAIKSNRLKAVQALLARKDIDVNAQDNYGDSALMLATKYREINIISALLKYSNLNVNHKNNAGGNALITAIKSNQPIEVLVLIMSHKNCAIDLNTVELFFKLVDLKALNAFCNAKNITAPMVTAINYKILMDSIINNNIELFKGCLSNINLNINSKDLYGQTALMKAVYYNRVDMVKCLINFTNIDINCKDITGKNALDIALKEGHSLIARVIINCQLLDYLISNYIN